MVRSSTIDPPSQVLPENQNLNQVLPENQNLNQLLHENQNLKEQIEKMRIEREKAEKEAQIKRERAEKNLEILEMGHKIKVLEMTNQLQSLKFENEKLRLTMEKTKAEEAIVNEFRNNTAVAIDDKSAFMTKAKQLSWGVEKFFGSHSGNALSHQQPLFTSYQNWYRFVIAILKRYYTSAYANKYLFVSKDFGQYHETVRFVSSRKFMKFNDNQMGACALNLTDGLWSHNETSSVVILHPKSVEKCLEMHAQGRTEDTQWWMSIDDISDEYYYGDNKTLVVCCMK